MRHAYIGAFLHRYKHIVSSWKVESNSHVFNAVRRLASLAEQRVSSWSGIRAVAVSQLIMRLLWTTFCRPLDALYPLYASDLYPCPSLHCRFFSQAFDHNRATDSCVRSLHGVPVSTSGERAQRLCLYVETTDIFRTVSPDITEFFFNIEHCLNIVLFTTREKRRSSVLPENLLTSSFSFLIMHIFSELINVTHYLLA